MPCPPTMPARGRRSNTAAATGRIPPGTETGKRTVAASISDPHRGPAPGPQDPATRPAPPARRPASNGQPRTPTVALHARADVPVPAHVLHVHPPPHHRGGAGAGRDFPGVVADVDRHRWRGLRIRLAPVGLAARHGLPVR